MLQHMWVVISITKKNGNRQEGNELDKAHLIKSSQGGHLWLWHLNRCPKELLMGTLVSCMYTEVDRGVWHTPTLTYMWIELDHRFRLEDGFRYCPTEEYVQIISLPGKLTMQPIATTSLPLPVKLSTCKQFSVACFLETVCRDHSFLISSEC